jgi:AraC-like DNA-binding protein
MEIGQREGLPIAQWFEGTGLDPARLFTDGTLKVSLNQAGAVLRRAVRAMPGRPLGMQTGGRDVLLTFGMIGVAMRSCATVGEAVDLGIQWHQASGSLLDADLGTSGPHTVLRLRERRADPEIVAFLCEEALSSIVIFARSMLGADWRPEAVELTYPEPSYSHRYQQLFRCPVVYRAPANLLVFPTTQMRQPLTTHNEPTRDIAVEACRRLLDLDHSRPDIVVAVEALLDQDLRAPITMAGAAQHLHVTERTLRRQLAAVAESFSAVRDRVRERRATFLLSTTALSISAVAEEIGFSEAREFRRAYRRWTGQPPSAVRRSPTSM